MQNNELSTSRKNLWRTISGFPQFSILAVTILTFLVLTFATKSFFSVSNMVNILRQCSTDLIVALGMTLVLILGGIDLSVGAVACLAGTLAVGLMVRNEISVPLAIMVGICVGILCGFINGFVVSKLNIAPFIATLAMNCTARGVALVYTGGRPIAGLPEQATKIGRGYVLGLPICVWVMLVVLIVMWVLLSRTRFSRHAFATGGNEECARLSGVKINKVKITSYIICSCLAGLCGILLTLRLGSGQPTLGEGMELDAISAAVLGGTSLSGGRGYIFGTVLGCFFLAMLSNGLNILQISSYWQQVLKGIILVVAVSIYNSKKE